jgi:hypothetical protein
MVPCGAIEAEREWYEWTGPEKPRPYPKERKKMKTKRERFLSREQVEKAFQKAVGALRKIRGFVNVEVKATVRVQDTDPNKAVVLVSKHAV